MYKVILIIDVYNEDCLEQSTHCTSFTKEIEIPFAPVPGQEISVDSDRSAVIAKVSWSTSESMFRVYLEDRFVEFHGFDEVSYEDWIEHFTERKWVCHGEYPT